MLLFHVFLFHGTLKSIHVYSCIEEIKKKGKINHKVEWKHIHGLEVFLSFFVVASLKFVAKLKDRKLKLLKSHFFKKQLPILMNNIR